MVDGIISSEIEVLSVLKGHTKPGIARLASQYWPYRGQYFLLYANHVDDPPYNKFVAIEAYRVIPLGHHFWTNALAGMTPEKQVQYMLNQRLKDLRGEISDDSNEISRLESGLKRDGQGPVTTTNSPPAHARPQGNGVNF
jgi:hypothetical protein